MRKVVGAHPRVRHSPAMDQTSPARRIAAGLLLALVAIVSAFLTRAALTEEVRTRVHGNASATVVRHVLQPQLAEVAGAAAVATVGIVLAVWLWPRPARVRSYGLAAALVVAAATVGTLPLIDSSAESVPAVAGPSFEDRESVVAAFRAADLACVQIAPLRDPTIPEGFTCIVATRAAREGRAWVDIGLWDEPEQRSAWLRDADGGESFGVAGPNWVALCRFQATCAEIQHRVGGRSF